MSLIVKNYRKRRGLRFLRGLVSGIFFCNTLLSAAPLFAQTPADLPAPGVMINLSGSFSPISLKGLTLYPQHPLRFDFIVDKGDAPVGNADLRSESNKLIKYFLASLTVPEKDLWVNLSPYEKDRIIAPEFGVTQMGRDLLAQDYLLKQLSASLTYPEHGLGKIFWEKVYAQVGRQYGVTEIPIDTFNKIWIIPDNAVVYEKDNTVFILESHLKVMLEEDYLISSNVGRGTKDVGGENQEIKQEGSKLTTYDLRLTTEIMREIILPAVEKEINAGKNFANLRQIYQSMILAIWYKQNLKETLLAKVYADQGKVKGVDIDDKMAAEKIYQQYLAAFKKGVYRYIKDDFDPSTQQVVPRKYFSGGFTVPESFRVQAANDYEGHAEIFEENRQKLRDGELFIAQTLTEEPAVAKEARDAAMIIDESWPTGFPTNSQLVSQGLNDFRDLLASLPEDLRGMVHDPRTGLGLQIFRVYIGVTPEWQIFLRENIYNERERLIKAIESNTNFQFIPRDPAGGHGSLINKQAALGVMRSSGDFPDEVMTNPNWFKDHPREWISLGGDNNNPDRDRFTIRYGILSGFPSEAAKKYPRYRRAKEKIVHRLEENPESEEYAYLRDAIDSEVTEWSENRQVEFQRQLILHMSDLLTTEEIDIVANKFSVDVWEEDWGTHRYSALSYSAFDPSDVEWAKRLEAVYQQALVEWDRMVAQTSGGDAAMLVDAAKLPTTREIVTEGLQAYKVLVEDSGLSESLRAELSHLESDFAKQIFSVYIGVTPERWLNRLGREENHALVTAIERNKNFRRVVHRDESGNNYSLINKKAASRVIRAGSDFPPEASADGWLENNSDQWWYGEGFHRRYGLLSGFSPGAVDKFERHIAVRMKILAHRNDFKGWEFKLLQRHFENINNGIRTGIIKKKVLLRIIKKRIKGLIDEDIAAHVNAFTTPFLEAEEGGYAAFSDEDVRWNNTLNSIYDDAVREWKRTSGYDAAMTAEVTLDEKFKKKDILAEHVIQSLRKFPRIVDKNGIPYILDVRSRDGVRSRFNPGLRKGEEVPLGVEIKIFLKRDNGAITNSYVLSFIVFDSGLVRDLDVNLKNLYWISMNPPAQAAAELADKKIGSRLFEKWGDALPEGVRVESFIANDDTKQEFIDHYHIDQDDHVRENATGRFVVDEPVDDDQVRAIDVFDQTLMGRLYKQYAGLEMISGFGVDTIKSILKQSERKDITLISAFKIVSVKKAAAKMKQNPQLLVPAQGIAGDNIGIALRGQKSQAEYGGIDFNPAHLNLQIKRDGKGVPLPVAQQDFSHIRLEGLTPIILDIKPATLQNLPFLLSQAEKESTELSFSAR